MAVDLSCYVSLPKEQVEQILIGLSIQHGELFRKKFLISAVSEADPVEREIALEQGLAAKSVFLVSLNEKSAANLVLEVAGLIKSVVGKEKVIILHGNDTAI